MLRVSIEPQLLVWARERAGISQEVLAKRFQKLPEWERGEVKPTYRQLESFAKSVHVPFGYLFFKFPPNETMPIPDFRTASRRAGDSPTINLLDTIYLCQTRQDWYRDYALIEELPNPKFVGSANIGMNHVVTAERMRETLEFYPQRSTRLNAAKAFRALLHSAEEVGVLAMVSNSVPNNSRRRLDSNEFCGFALSDPVAPLIFVNGAVSEAVKVFALAQELAHIWLGVTALSDVGVKPAEDAPQEEIWCSAVAAEFLVPSAALRSVLSAKEPLEHSLSRLASYFNVSRFVILRRFLDIGQISQSRFASLWSSEELRVRQQEGHRTGGDRFYRSIVARSGRRFARALVVSALNGRTPCLDAYKMLGVRGFAGLKKLGKELGLQT